MPISQHPPPTRRLIHGLHRIIFGIALAIGITYLVVGCNRLGAVPVVPAKASAPPRAWTADIDDAVVTFKVKSALLSDQDIKASNIKVETRNGMVSLSGYVNTQAQIERAVSRARTIKGVKGVVTDISVETGAKAGVKT